MKYNPEINHKKSIRLKDYDYSKPGAYFITICTYQRQSLFAEIIGDKSDLNQLGKIVENEWLQTSKIRENIILDEYVIMPDHFHGIIIIEEGCMQYTPTSHSYLTADVEFKSTSKTIGSIIRGFKASVTKKINEHKGGVKIKVWQSNYYEKIIRDEKGLNAVREYIINNPMKLHIDNLHPK